MEFPQKVVPIKEQVKIVVTERKVITRTQLADYLRKRATSVDPAIKELMWIGFLTTQLEFTQNRVEKVIRLNGFHKQNIQEEGVKVGRQ